MTSPASAVGTAPRINLWDAVKGVAQFLGVVGGGGGGFAALAFGIGYLATKAHDAMYGLPTTTTAYAAYVRTGALFFSSSIHDATLVMVSPPVLWTFAGLVVVVAGLGAFPKPRAAIIAHPAVIGLAHLLVVGAVLAYLPYHVEPLDQRNTGILFRADSAATADSAASHAAAEGAEASLTRALRRQDSEPLHRRYGTQFAVTAILIAGTYALRRWRRTLQPATAASAWIGIADWLARPLLYTMLMALVITIPTIYGALALPPPPCVQAFVAKRDTDLEGNRKKVGVLWTDLSTEGDQVVILEGAVYGFTQRFYKRDLVRSLETVNCETLR